MAYFMESISCTRHKKKIRAANNSLSHSTRRNSCQNLTGTLGVAITTGKVESPSTLPVVIATPSVPVNFWQEFLRVECDKLLLAALIFFLWRVHEIDSMKYAIGGLIVAINHNRFRWS